MIQQKEGTFRNIKSKMKKKNVSINSLNTKLSYISHSNVKCSISCIMSCV